MRLFTFYFSDQVAIILALSEIKALNNSIYQNQISWIDIKTSQIINLNASLARFMWYPKGQNNSQKNNSSRDMLI